MSIGHIEPSGIGRESRSSRQVEHRSSDKKQRSGGSTIYPELAEDPKYGDVALVRAWSGGRKYCAVIRWDQVPGLISDLRELLDARF